MGFSFAFNKQQVYTIFLDALSKVAQHYSDVRLGFIKSFTERRLEHVGHLLAKASKFRSSAG